MRQERREEGEEGGYDDWRLWCLAGLPVYLPAVSPPQIPEHSLCLLSFITCTEVLIFVHQLCMFYMESMRYM